MFKCYKLCIKQFNVFLNDYLCYVRYLETNDLYHFIGYLYCNSLEYIESISYVEITKEEYDTGINKVHYKGNTFIYDKIKPVGINFKKEGSK